MKYDILSQYRQYLDDNLKPCTANTYYFALDRLLKNVPFNSVNEIDMDLIKERISAIKNKNDFSAAKNALKHLKIAFPALNIPDEDYFKRLSIKKRNWTKKPAATLYYDETMRKINGIKDVKKKYAFRLMLASGLRVSEVAALIQSDIKVEDGSITVEVRNGKGGANGTVECLPDKYLAQRLPTFIADAAAGEPLFHSAHTLKKKAGELGLECHDLRRIAAINHRKAHIKEQGASRANAGVKTFLRHARFSVTKRYLFNKKLKVKRSKREE